MDPAVFACISMVSLAVGPLIAKDIHDIMDSMFAAGLRYCYILPVTGKCLKLIVLLHFNIVNLTFGRTRGLCK